MQNLEKPEFKNQPESPEEELKVPMTLPEMERALEDVFTELETIKVFSGGRNVEAESLKWADYGNRILGRMKIFLKNENDPALNSRLREIKTILNSNGSLNNVKKLFVQEEERAA